MNFDFSDEQKEVKDQAHRFLKDKCDPSVVRRILETDEPYSKDLWKAVAEMGWTAAALPEEYGGIGYGYLELCVIAEELGRAVAPIPFSSSIYLAAEALLLAGSEEQKQKFLPKIATGELIGTLALAEGTHATTAANLSTRFDGTKLDGAKSPVPDGDIADFAVVVAKTGDAVSLVLTDLTGDGITRQPIETIDPTRSHARVTFTSVPAEPLGPAGEGLKLVERIFDRAAILMAFEQLGGAAACLDMGCGYAVERYAFGRPIGSFQAVKHRLADMYVNNELARSNAYYGAWALSSNAPELPIAAATARVSAIEAYHFASKENIQVHGGMGFTWEADCHLYYRRSKLLALALGSPRVWKEKLITHLEKQQAAKPATERAAQPVA